MKVTTWNVNGVRAREAQVLDWALQEQPDVLCLQETKVQDGEFPFEMFRKLGYEHIEISGQKGYHGVATLSRRPLQLVEKRRFCDIDHCRHLSVRVEAGGKSLLIHNFYVPAGGDEPDPEG